jgi:hypothetical protein
LTHRHVANPLRETGLWTSNALAASIGSRAKPDGGLMANAFPHGTVHEAGEDLQAALQSDAHILG